MALHLIDRSFAAGELTPELFSRVDFNKFAQGLALCKNFITLPHGPAVNRPGTEFVHEVKDSTKAVRLIPFSYNNVQTFAIEVGEGYFRFHTQAAVLGYDTPAAYNGATAYAIGDMAASGGVNYYCTSPTTGNAPPNASYWYAMPTGPNIYEIPNPYAAVDVMDIHYVQSADVITLVHPNYPPMELRRYGAANWQTVVISMSPKVAPPSATPAAGTPITHDYVVTAICNVLNGAIPQKVESTQSASVTCSNDLTITGNSNKVTWSAVPSATSYRIYKKVGADYCYLGTPTSGTEFVDDITFTPDTSKHPPTVAAGAGVPSGVAVTATTVTISVVGAAATTGTGTTTYTYCVTSLTDDGSESIASSTTSCTNNLDVAGNINTITWPSATGASRYNVYKSSNGMFGYIGQAIGNSFVDNNITADISLTPPITVDPFVGSGNYPSAVSYYQQRRCFAGTSNQPQNLWLTRSGTESDMSYTIPVRDDNRIAVKIASREASAIRHIVPVGQLLMLSASCEMSIPSDVLTPTTISLKPQSYNGANNVTPVIIGNIVLYGAARGGHLRELSYNWQAGGYLSSDVSLLAPHLFDYNQIVDMAFARGPVPILWAVSSTGTLLGMTYVQDQQVAAWHQHSTGNGDTFESICTISENNEDMLYTVVRRTINGSTKRYVERMHTRKFVTAADAFFVDCGATYSGAPTMTLSGLTWLEGMTVNILADGAVAPPQVVTGGAVTLDHAASTVHVGLPITAQLQTMPVAAQVDPAFGQGRPKNVNKVWLRVYRSSGVFAGPSFSSLTAYKQRTNEPYGTPPALVSDEIEITLMGAWTRGGQICVQQSDPLPLDIASMTLEISMGGG